MAFLRSRRWLAWGLIWAIWIVVAVGFWQPATSQTTEEPLTIWRVGIHDSADIHRLFDAGFDVLEARGDDYVLVLGDAAVERQLTETGWKLEVHEQLPALGSREMFPFYNGYRTIVEHYAHLDSLATNYPNLVTLVDYGDSWQKTQVITQGYDLRAICITAKQAGDCELDPQSTKPRFMLMAAIHARELTTSELAWRWMDELVTKYGSDPSITELLNYNEMWIIPVVNPDGRKIVESGGNSPYYQRKNTHDYSGGACPNPPAFGSSSHLGVDLNRNADFQWGGAGTSTNACSQTYRGLNAASEPETYQLQSLLAQLFPDQRSDAVTSPAPLTTTGTFITLHTYSNLVLFPWGYTECFGSACPVSKQAPNDAGLRSLGFRMSYFNNYDTGQPSELLYAASGGTDDWAYGKLGVASYTFEVGPEATSANCGGFLPVYSCQDSKFWGENREAFLYAGWAARQPYTLSLGPSALNVTSAVTEVVESQPLSVTATIADDRYGINGVNRPAVQVIEAAEAWIDTPPWESGTPIPLMATDGVFNSPVEAMNVAVPTTGLAVGRHTLWVRGKDTTGTWGPPTPIWFWVKENTTPPLQYIYVPFATK